ncbi:hypothetical protein BDY24DRAFT_79027 [Mrakia frigida]|uniref:uncharacterized protein n=1 Tax=Mrakia frigida TaxID=29902 RepID=UPI003FCC14CA
MSGDTLEAAVLSGAIFRDQSSSLSEYRDEDRQTPSPTNTDDELGSDLDDDTFTPPQHAQAANGDPSSRTGPKGVIRDQREAAERARTGQILKTRQGNQEMERRALLAGTWEEDERMRKEDEDRKNGITSEEEDEVKRRWREKRLQELEGGGKRKGFLREVSLEGYLHGVEDDGWTVVLVFEPSLPTLPSLLPQLQSLASHNPPPHHSFLLVRATTLSFSLLQNGEPDKDVLPTMLIYGPGGDLLENWVRVDLMLKEQASGSGGLEGLLIRRGVIPERDSRAEYDDNSEDDRQDSD